MLNGALQESRVVGLSARRRRLLPTLDVGPFLMFFGVSGETPGREAQLQKRFEREYYAHLVTLKLSDPLAPGRYVLRGLPPEANKRGWTVLAGGRSAGGELSAEGLDELRTWLGGGERRVRAEALPGPG